jgi:hypothetical protein
MRPSGRCHETVSESHKTGQDALSPGPHDSVSKEQGHPALDLHAKVSHFTAST